MKFNRNRKKRGVTNPDKFYIWQQFRNFYKIKNSFSFNTRTYTYNNFVFIAETEVASEFICFFFIDNKLVCVNPVRNNFDRNGNAVSLKKVSDILRRSYNTVSFSVKNFQSFFKDFGDHIRKNE